MLLERLVKLVGLGQPEQLVLQVKLEQQDRPVQLEVSEHLELLDRLEDPERLGQLVLVVALELLVRVDQPVVWDQQEPLAQLVEMGPQEQRVSQVEQEG